MGKKLTGNTYVNGELHEAGSTPPKEVADQITNEKLWAPVEDDSDDAEDTPARKTAARKSTSSGR